MDARTSHVIIVLGMHRGGTSAIARGLKAIGVSLGDNLRSGNANNPTGFWEDVDCLAMNEELLRHFHSGSHLALACRFSELDPTLRALREKALQLVRRKKMECTGPWGFKDPRTSRFLPFWRQSVEACGFATVCVIAVRNPLSVALSLQERDGIPVEKSCFLWLQHMVPAVLESAGAYRVVVDYDLLMDEPLLQLQRMSSILGETFSTTNGSSAAEYQEFLERKLRHTKFSLSDVALDDRIPEDVGTVYDLLLRAAKDEIDLCAPDVVQTFNAVKSRLQKFAPAFAYADALEEDRTRVYRNLVEHERQTEFLNQTLQERRDEVASLSHSLRELELALSVMETSMSWRVTAPLRLVYGFLKQLAPRKITFEKRLRGRLSRKQEG
jgi:O-antigen biosynthesis protein